MKLSYEDKQEIDQLRQNGVSCPYIVCVYPILNTWYDLWIDMALKLLENVK